MDAQLQEWLVKIGGVPTLVAVAVGIAAVLVLKKILSRPKSSPHLATATCQHCGWTGSVSRYKPVCPRCARPIRL